MRVLLIEDDSATAQMLEQVLKAGGYVVDSTDFGEDGLDMSKIYDYDLILLDLMLPDIDGHKVLARLRSASIKTPVMILSGRGQIDDKLKGLDGGADDYLTKPFDRRELLSRIQAVIRRSKGHSSSRITIGKLVVNLDAQTVEVDGRTVHLTIKEYRIMELLAIRKGTTLTKEMFLNHLYGGMDEPEAKIIDVFICKLRKKLQEVTDGEDYIETVWGRGYMLKDPVGATSQPKEASVQMA
jgi:two-component system cell cycle response regulator CtrA